MPTNLATVAVILLFVAPGFVYYSAIQCGTSS